MGVVTFNPGAFTQRYPEFVTIQASTLQAYFAEATIYLSNTDSSLVSDTAQRAVLLNMIVAHLAALNSGINGNEAPDTVGRVSDATQGSVSVSLDMGSQPGSAAWWQQTKYGAAYWQATASYRTMRYVSGSSVPQRWPQWPR